MGKRSTETTSAEVGADFGRIVEGQYDRVYRAILTLVRDPAEAQGLTQETFMKAYRGLSRFRGEASVSTWLLRIARNAVADRYRWRARRVDDRTVALGDGGSGDAIAAAVLTPAQAAERQRSGECIRQCVQSVAEPYREVVRLHDLQDLSNPEIATALGLSLDTVKIRVHRGREQLRATFERQCEVYRDERNELACHPARDGC